MRAELDAGKDKEELTLSAYFEHSVSKEPTSMMCISIALNVHLPDAIYDIGK